MGYAITSLVLGHVGHVVYVVPVLPIITSIIGLITGTTGLSKSKMPGVPVGKAVTGKVLAIVGIVMNAVSLVLGIIMGCVYLSMI